MPFPTCCPGSESKLSRALWVPALGRQAKTRCTHTGIRTLIGNRLSRLSTTSLSHLYSYARRLIKPSVPLYPEFPTLKKLNLGPRVHGRQVYSQSYENNSHALQLAPHQGSSGWAFFSFCLYKLCRSQVPTSPTHEGPF